MSSPDFTDRMRSLLESELLRVCREGDRNAVTMLVDHKGVSVDCTDPITGSRPIIEAVKNGHFEITKYLLWRSTNSVDHLDGAGWSALHWSVVNGDYAITTELIEFGADVDAQSIDDGLCPLHLAVLCNAPTICKLLMDSDCAVDALYEGLTVDEMLDFLQFKDCGNTGIRFGRRRLTERAVERLRDIIHQSDSYKKWRGKMDKFKARNGSNDRSSGQIEANDEEEVITVMSTEDDDDEIWRKYLSPKSSECSDDEDHESDGDEDSAKGSSSESSSESRSPSKRMRISIGHDDEDDNDHDHDHEDVIGDIMEYLQRDGADGDDGDGNESNHSNDSEHDDTSIDSEHDHVVVHSVITELTEDGVGDYKESEQQQRTERKRANSSENGRNLSSMETGNDETECTKTTESEMASLEIESIETVTEPETETQSVRTPSVQTPDEVTDNESNGSFSNNTNRRRSVDDIRSEFEAFKAAQLSFNCSSTEDAIEVEQELNSLQEAITGITKQIESEFANRKERDESFRNVVREEVGGETRDILERSLSVFEQWLRAMVEGMGESVDRNSNGIRRIMHSQNQLVLDLKALRKGMEHESEWIDSLSMGQMVEMELIRFRREHQSQSTNERRHRVPKQRLHRKQNSLPSLGQSVTEYTDDLGGDLEANPDVDDHGMNRIEERERGHKRRGSLRLHQKSQSSSALSLYDLNIKHDLNTKHRSSPRLPLRPQNQTLRNRVSLKKRLSAPPILNVDDDRLNGDDDRSERMSSSPMEMENVDDLDRVESESSSSSLQIEHGAALSVIETELSALSLRQKETQELYWE